ncbi:hypothetical protein G7Y79_00009g025840 [Physcia stellaris]|nr:hypothetical protein G7Y79_00009g025840 [Physcia stellaris]
MDPTANTFEAALSSLAALTALQPHLTGASHLLKPTKKLIEEKITTLARSPSHTTKHLPRLAKIRGELHRCNISTAQVDALIDAQLRPRSGVDGAGYLALLETRRVLASEALGFEFSRLDALIGDVAEQLRDDEVVVNQIRGKEIVETPQPKASQGRGETETEKGEEASGMEVMSDVAPEQGPEGSEEEMDYGDEVTTTPIQPRRLSLTLSSPHENRGGRHG